MNEDRIREIFREELMKIMGDYSKIPLEVSNALAMRGVTGTASGTATTQSINLTGLVQTITVPAQPSGTILVNFGGATYELLYK